jgi:hypothetical protein
MSENQEDEDPPPVYLDGIIDGWIRMPEGMDAETKNEWWRREAERCKALDDLDRRYFEIADELARRTFAGLTQDDDPLRYTHANRLSLDSQGKYIEDEIEDANCEYAWRRLYECLEDVLQDESGSEKSNEAGDDSSDSRPELDRGDDSDIGQQPEDDSSSRSGDDPE